MKEIVLDQLQRRWLIWAAFCLLSLAAGLMLSIIRDIPFWGVFFLPVWMTAFAIRSEWDAGLPRVLLSLPFNALQVGRAFWWMGVGVPTLLLALFSGVGVLIATSFTNTQGSFVGTWLEMVLGGGLLYGSFFWLWSGAPTKLPEKWPNGLIGQLYSYIFAIGMIGGIYFLYNSNISNEDKTAIVYFFGAAFTILGWFRAEGMVIDYGSYRREVTGVSKSWGNFHPRPGYGGVPYLLISFCLRYLSMASVIIAFFVCITIWHGHWSNRSDFVSGPTWQVQFWFFFLCFFQVATIGPSLKFLRSLPLTSKQLAATILCMAILPVLIIGGLCSSLLLIKFGVHAGIFLFKVYLLGLAPVCALITGAVWHNEKRFERIMAAVIALIVSMIPIIYQLTTTNWDSGSKGLPIWIIIAVPAGSFFAALLTISRLLERNDMTYRIREEMLKSWQF